MAQLPTPSSLGRSDTASLSPAPSTSRTSAAPSPQKGKGKPKDGSQTRRGRWSNAELAELTRIGDDFVTGKKEEWEVASTRLMGDVRKRSVTALRDRYVKIKKERKAKEKEEREKEEAEQDLVVEKEEVGSASPAPATVRSATPLAAHASLAPPTCSWSTGEDGAILSAICTASTTPKTLPQLINTVARIYQLQEHVEWSKTPEETLVKFRWWSENLSSILTIESSLTNILHGTANRLHLVAAEVFVSLANSHRRASQSDPSQQGQTGSQLTGSRQVSAVAGRSHPSHLSLPGSTNSHSTVAQQHPSLPFNPSLSPPLASSPLPRSASSPSLVPMRSLPPATSRPTSAVHAQTIPPYHPHPSPLSQSISILPPSSTSATSNSVKQQPTSEAFGSSFGFLPAATSTVASTGQTSLSNMGVEARSWTAGGTSGVPLNVASSIASGPVEPLSANVKIVDFADFLPPPSELFLPSSFASTSRSLPSDGSVSGPSASSSRPPSLQLQVPPTPTKKPKGKGKSPSAASASRLSGRASSSDITSPVSPVSEGGGSGGPKRMSTRKRARKVSYAEQYSSGTSSSSDKDEASSPASKGGAGKGKKSPTKGKKRVKSEEPDEDAYGEEDAEGEDEADVEAEVKRSLRKKIKKE